MGLIVPPLPLVILEGNLQSQPQVGNCTVTIKGERMSTTAHERSTTADEKNNQRNEMNVEDSKEPPGIDPQELEREMKSVSNCDKARTDDDAHALGASGGVEDVGNVHTELQNASERDRARLEHRTEEDLPKRSRVDPDDPGDEDRIQ